MHWYLEALQKRYAQFHGCAHREEFWMFVAVNLGITVAVAIVAALIHLRALRALYGLAVFVPSIAIGARRLHDTGRSGWWQLVGMVPILGIIVLIVLWAQDGQPGDNRYGSDPRAVRA